MLASKLCGGIVARMSFKTAADRVEKAWKKLVEAKTQLVAASGKKDLAQREYDEAYAAFNAQEASAGAKETKASSPIKSEPKKAAKAAKASDNESLKDRLQRTGLGLKDATEKWSLTSLKAAIVKLNKLKWNDVSIADLYRVKPSVICNLRVSMRKSHGTKSIGGGGAGGQKLKLLRDVAGADGVRDDVLADPAKLQDFLTKHGIPDGEAEAKAKVKSGVKKVIREMLKEQKATQKEKKAQRRKAAKAEASTAPAVADIPATPAPEALAPAVQEQPVATQAVPEAAPVKEQAARALSD